MSHFRQAGLRDLGREEPSRKRAGPKRRRERVIEGGSKEPLPIDDHHLEEKGTRYIDFLIPGLLGMNLMGGGLFGVGFVIVDMRVRKLLKRFLATPMRRSHFMLAIMISRLLFLIPEVLMLLTFAWLAFDVTIQGTSVQTGASSSDSARPASRASACSSPAGPRRSKPFQG